MLPQNRHYRYESRQLDAAQSGASAREEHMPRTRRDRPTLLQYEIELMHDQIGQETRPPRRVHLTGKKFVQSSTTILTVKVLRYFPRTEKYIRTASQNGKNYKIQAYDLLIKEITLDSRLVQHRKVLLLAFLLITCGSRV